MMNIRVRVFGSLASTLGRKHDINLEEGATIRVLTNKLAKNTNQHRSGYLGEYKVGGGNLAIMVNGRNIDLLNSLDTDLNDGDDVVILHPTAGG
jgi:MoaD family protein